MKAFLFFLGTAIRAMAIQPQRFLIFHGYLLMMYFLTYTAKSNSISAYGLIFTILAVSPLFLAISRGLPVDCLNYENAIYRELKSQND